MLAKLGTTTAVAYVTATAVPSTATTIAPSTAVRSTATTMPIITTASISSFATAASVPKIYKVESKQVDNLDDIFANEPNPQQLSLVLQQSSLQ